MPNIKALSTGVVFAVFALFAIPKYAESLINTTEGTQSSKSKLFSAFLNCTTSDSIC